MRFYWKCSDCDEINDYSKTKICETCGADITDSEEHRIQKEIQLEKERKEAERIRRKKLEEAERKRRLEEQLRKMEEERQRKLLEDRRRTSNIIKQSCRIPSIVMRALIGVATVAAIIICIVNSSNLNFENVFKNPGQNISTEFDAHMDIIEVEKTSADVSKDDAKQDSKEADSSKENESKITKQKIPHFANNIREEFLYLSQNFHPIDNFLNFIGVEQKDSKEDK